MFEELSYVVGSVGFVGEALAVLARAREEVRSVSVWALSPGERVGCLDLLQALECEVAGKKLEAVREVDAEGFAVEQGATSTAA